MLTSNPTSVDFVNLGLNAVGNIPNVFGPTLFKIGVNGAGTPFAQAAFKPAIATTGIGSAMFRGVGQLFPVKAIYDGIVYTGGLFSCTKALITCEVITMALTKSHESWQTASVLVAGFSFLVLSAYLLLWHHSNRDMRIIAVAAFFFLAAVILAPRKDITVGAAFLFAGLRWAFAAVVTLEPKAVIGAILFLSVPVILLLMESRRRGRIL